MTILSPLQLCKSATRARSGEPGAVLQFPQFAVSLNPDYETGRHQKIPEPTTIRPVSDGVYRWPSGGDSASGLPLCDAALGGCRGLSGSANGPSLGNDYRLAASRCSIGISSTCGRGRLTRHAESWLTPCLPAQLQVDGAAWQIRCYPFPKLSFMRATAFDSILL